jgi:hypothetical protein
VLLDEGTESEFPLPNICSRVSVMLAGVLLLDLVGSERAGGCCLHS